MIQPKEHSFSWNRVERGTESQGTSLNSGSLDAQAQHQSWLMMSLPQKCLLCEQLKKNFPFCPGLASSTYPVSIGEAYGAAQASSETDLLNRFILLKPKPSQGDSSEAKTPSQ